MAHPLEEAGMTRDIMVRKLPDETYETIRRIAFEAVATHADVIAYAVDCASRWGRGTYAANEVESRVGQAFADLKKASDPLPKSNRKADTTT